MVKQFIFAVFLCILFSVQTAEAAERVRVDVSDGAPRILVDGKPVRARMFYGNPGYWPISIEAGAQRISFEFQPLESEPNGATMHFRFENKAQALRLDDMSVEEIGSDQKVFGPCKFENGVDDFSSEWSFWPTGDANTTGEIRVEPQGGVDDSGVLTVRLKKPENGNWPDFHFYHHPNLSLDKSKKYRVSFWIHSDVTTSLRIGFYRPGQRFTFLGGGGKNFFQSQIEMAVDSGARFISFPVGLPWLPPGKEVDWSDVDAACQRVLDANPNALLLPRVPMDPPAWWVEANPGDVIAWKGTPHEARKVAAVSSEKYRREASERLDALIRHLEQKFGSSMAGYHPCGQNTGEWFYQDSWGNALNGYAEADAVAWRAWRKKRYENEDEVEIPSPELRRSTSGGVFRDVALEPAQRIVLDFVEFQQEMMAETVLTFARTVREASQGKRLSVFFYGYVFEFGALQTGPATSGHYALRRVLESPDIDILCSPISYHDRKLGGSGAAMTAAESVALAGKMWLYEDDTRTHLTPGPFTFPGGGDGADTVDETRQHLLRNTGQCSLRNFGTWWMDLGTAGWFDDPKLWAEMKRLETVDRHFLDHPTPFRPEVAAIIDEQSMLSVAQNGNVMSRPAVYTVREAFARMGTPYGQYLLDDFLDGKVDAKLNVLVAAWRLSCEQRKALKNRTENPGTVTVWCFAPGYLDENLGGSVENIRELTGFSVKSLENVHAWAEPTPLGKSLGLDQGFGVKHPIRPLFAVTDAKPEETLAVYSDGSAAMVLRGNVIFVGPPGLTPSLLRLAARKADVHIFTEKDCNVYANGPFVFVHAAEDGPVEIDFGRIGRILDPLDGSDIGNGPKKTFPMKLGETRLFRIERE